MENLKKIPPVDEILLHEEVQELLSRFNRDYVINLLRAVMGDIREELRTQQEEMERDLIKQEVIKRLQKRVDQSARGTLEKVINGTGVVLHTNLGRAPLGERALHYMSAMAVNYNNLEMDLERGERGSRYVHVEEILTRLTGAEAALVVNNNAAAVMLGLNTMAREQEVIVSRGQLVEIGGAFRIPEVMKLSGARLVEVGTTNKTYISDFAGAISKETALLFTAHTSNYKIIGFSEEVKLSHLVKLGEEHGVPVMQDLGSGILYNMEDWGLKDEPSVQQCVASGVDIITFSGDKLLGGPQAGIIVGREKYIEAMKKNQLTRALRVDKLTIAALEATLLEYLEGKPEEKIPVIRMLCYSSEQLQGQAEELLDNLHGHIGSLPQVASLTLVELDDMVGGGAYPTYKIPGFGIDIEFHDNALEKIARELRLGSPALVTRKQDDKMRISVRTLLEGDAELLVDLIEGVLTTDVGSRM
ncbi:MAG: L-seryl-tRNA(Sec) selenium transferase [Syntrophomonadaceae bacterium]|nr:L-seryl-tRNA(Sec) selenium transferase [Syntrophomonadaceae bacterium]